METQFKPNRFDLALAAALMVSLGINAALTWHLLRGGGRPAADARQEQRLESGAQLPPLDVRTLGGSAQQLKPAAGKGLLLYVLSPACGWCDRNVANVKALAAAVTAQGHYDLAGVSLSPKGLAEHLNDNDFGFPVFVAADNPSARTYKLASTPNTLVIAPDGRLEAQYLGAFTAATGAAIEERFGLRLPGLNPSQATARN